MIVADLVRAMEEIAPTRFAAPWDNVGLLVGDPAAEVSRVLLTIDCTAAVLGEARTTHADAIVAYHPPIFEPLKRFVAGAVVYGAARAGIAVYCPHTALDVAEGGTNDVLADALGMAAREPLRSIDGVRGFGRVGDVERTSLAALVRRVKGALALDHVLVAGALDREVTRAAVCAGSGGEFIGDALAHRAAVLLTGELRHHDALRATEAGLAVVCTRHSLSERAALISLERRLTEGLPGVAFVRSTADRDPFAVI
jgi:dinuclear metal center YbgI/SA1388 family protein